MNNDDITRRGLVLGGLALLISGCSMARTAEPLSYALAPKRGLNPRFRRKHVRYQGSEPAGTIVVNTSERFLYPVEEGGWATRYGVGVGEQGRRSRASNHRPQGGVAFVDPDRQHDEAQTALGAICRRG